MIGFTDVTKVYCGGTTAIGGQTDRAHRNDLGLAAVQGCSAWWFTRPRRDPIPARPHQGPASRQPDLT